MIHLYCGDGKGKTSSAVGQLIRAVGNGRTGIFAQFMKCGETGEVTLLKCIDQVMVIRSDEKFGFYNTLSEEEKKQLAQENTRIIREVKRAVITEMLEEKQLLVVLDELTYTLNWNLVDEDQVWELINMARESQDVELVITGRDPAPALVELADYVSEIKKVKHPFDRGISARRGIEF